MPRLKEKRYQRHVMFAMTIYIAVMLLVWPLVRTATSVPLRWLLALAPLPPMLYVIALMAQRIRDSDELQQRTHLISLGVATDLGCDSSDSMALHWRKQHVRMDGRSNGA